MQIAVGVITVSDRASRGLYDDLGGPALQKAARAYGWEVLAEALVADEKREIQRAIREQAAKGCHVVLTTGGTGVALRDVTPEAVREIASRELPGFGEVMRMESMKLTKNAILSRSLAAVVDKSMYTAVMERTREIGILKSLGASKWYIVNVVLRETLLLAVVGIVVGIILSMMTRRVIMFEKPVLRLFWSNAWALRATVIAIVGALAGALYPAVKAAQKDPIDALAYE